MTPDLGAASAGSSATFVSTGISSTAVLALADQLIRPHDGAITVVYRDIDVSRSLP